MIKSILDIGPTKARLLAFISGLVCLRRAPNIACSFRKKPTRVAGVSQSPLRLSQSPERLNEQPGRCCVLSQHPLKQRKASITPTPARLLSASLHHRLADHRLIFAKVRLCRRRTNGGPGIRCQRMPSRITGLIACQP